MLQNDFTNTDNCEICVNKELVHARIESSISWRFTEILKGCSRKNDSEYINQENNSCRWICYSEILQEGLFS